MSVEVVKGDEYSLEYHGDLRQLQFRGTIRLQASEDYLPMLGLMQTAQAACAATGETLVMDFHQLEFLNSSGINSISKFVIAARKEAKIGLEVRGNKDIYWQQKSLQNLQKLWPKVIITIT
jgi:hypothetical protein